MNRAAANKSTSVASHSSTVKALLSFCLLVVVSFQLQAQDSTKKGTLIPGPQEIFGIKKDTGNRKTTDTLKLRTTAEIVEEQLQGKLTCLAFTPDNYQYFLSENVKRRRTKIIAATNILGYSGAMVGLYHAWYKNYPQSNFHSFNDLGEWKGIDKIGHMYSAYAESKASMELWRWTGIDRKKRIWLGGMSGAFYQTVIETLDGFSSEWGWSWGDFSANILGSGMLVAQELAWDEQRIQFKFSFHHKTYNDPSLIQRSNKIFGASTAERFLKDYNGQTYWLSANLHSFFPKSNLPPWLMLAVGTGAEGMFGANENIGKDANGNINFSRTDIKRYRQWYLAPDIDLTKIKTKKKGIKVALNILNIVKFPMPSLEYSNGKFKVNAITF